MRKTALIFGIGASFILAAGAANAAGTCGADVAALQQKIGMDEGANATIGATDPGVQQPSPSASVDTSTGATTGTTNDQVADSNSGANATIGANDPGVQQPQDMDPTDDANTSASSGATTMPSGDVTETSRVGDMTTSAGGRAEAITALKKAQLAADAGDESTCMSELGAARAALGVQ